MADTLTRRQAVLLVVRMVAVGVVIMTLGLVLDADLPLQTALLLSLAISVGSLVFAVLITAARVRWERRR